MLYRDDQLVRFIDMHLVDYPQWVGKTAATLRQEQSQIVVAIKRVGQYHYAPDLETTFKPNDILIIIGKPLGDNRKDT